MDDDKQNPFVKPAAPVFLCIMTDFFLSGFDGLIVSPIVCFSVLSIFLFVNRTGAGFKGKLLFFLLRVRRFIRFISPSVPFAA